MKPMTYTADVQTLHSGTIAFENVPENIYRAVIDLLGGRGVIETREDPSRPSGQILTMGQTLRKLRSRANLTPRQVATWCGVTPTTVHRWEKGDREPRSTCKERLRCLYGVQSLHILADDEKERAK